MQIVHLGHSCVLLITPAGRILVDPGTFSSGFEDLRDLDAVLVTHQHPDHLDVDRLGPLLDANPQAELVVDAGTAPELRDRQHRVARVGENLALAGLSIDVVGGEHAVIHPDIPVIPNNGYLFSDGETTVLHPGDALAPRLAPVDVLLLPTGAPWLKLSESVDYLRAVAPRLAVPIHEAVLATPGMYYDRFAALAPQGTEVRPPTRGEPMSL